MSYDTYPEDFLPLDGNKIMKGNLDMGGYEIVNCPDVPSSGSNQVLANAGLIIDGGSSAILPGIKGDIVCSFSATIKSVELLADQIGSIVVDIWKNTYSNFPPTDIDSITASSTPEITNSVKASDLALSNWITTVNAGDVLRFNVDSCNTIKRCSVILTLEKTL